MYNYTFISLYSIRVIKKIILIIKDIENNRCFIKDLTIAEKKCN